MSVEELARKIGKDRSTIYRYENGDIGNMPLELVSPMVEALEMTPQELLSFFMLKSEWLSQQTENGLRQLRVVSLMTKRCGCFEK